MSSKASESSSSATRKSSRSSERKIKKVAGFELLNKIGQGGMGTVFKARQLSLDRIVALKLLPPSIAQNENYIERFQREARASGKLVHPNVIQGIDVGKDEETGLWYFAMEYAEGQDLAKELKCALKLPEKRVLEIALSMARALECAEKHGIVHRDIKPANILQTRSGDFKLADLGLAKRLVGEAEDLTQDGKAVGTPFYMSPEQIRGENDRVDIRSDIYALGASLFHLVTGRCPYEGSSSPVIMSLHLTAPVPNARSVDPQVSEGFARILQRMLQKDQKDRYQNAGELKTALEQFIRNEKTGHFTTGPRRAVRKTTGPQKPITGKRTPISERARDLAPVRPPAKSSLPIFVLSGIIVCIAAVLFTVINRDSDNAARNRAANNSFTGAQSSLATAQLSDTSLASRTEKIANEQQKQQLATDSKLIEPAPPETDTNARKEQIQLELAAKSGEQTQQAAAQSPSAAFEQAQTDAKLSTASDAQAAQKRLEKLLVEMDDLLLTQQNWAGAQARLMEEEKDESMQPVRSQLKALGELSKVVEANEQKVLQYLKGMIGSQVNWEIKRIPRGSRTRLIGVERGSLTFELKAGDGPSATISGIGLNELPVEALQKLQEEHPQSDAARVFAAMRQLETQPQNLQSAEELLASASAFALQAHYRSRFERVRLQQQLERSASAWRSIAGAVKKAQAGSDALQLYNLLNAFKHDAVNAAFIEKNAEEIKIVVTQCLRLLDGDGLLGEYFDAPDFTQLKQTRVDPTIDFDWEDGIPEGVPYSDGDTFSVRWTGKLKAPNSARYTFNTAVDDGVRLTIDGKTVIEKWEESVGEFTGEIELEAGRFYEIKLEYREDYGLAVIRLYWQSPTLQREIIPQKYLFSGRALETRAAQGVALAKTEPDKSVLPQTLTVNPQLELAAIKAWEEILRAARFVDLAADKASQTQRLLQSFEERYAGTLLAREVASLKELVKVRSTLPDLRRHLVGYWPFDEKTGLRVNDYSNKGHVGTFESASWVAGISGTALFFDDDNDINIRITPELIPGERPFSLTAWIRTASMESIGVVNARKLESGNHWAMRISGGFVHLTANDGSHGYELWGQIPVSDNQWHHLALVRSPTGFSLFVDGKADGTIETAPGFKLENFDSFRLANNTTNARDGFIGFLDEVRYFNLALEPGQLQAMAMNLMTEAERNAPPLAVPADAAEFFQHRYKVYRDRNMNWEEACKFCEARGGYLVTLSSAQEHRFAFNLCKKFGMSQEYWIGLTDKETEGQWKWITNEASNAFGAWAKGNPTSNTVQNAAVLQVIELGVWVDRPHNEARAFICEWSPPQP